MWEALLCKTPTVFQAVTETFPDDVFQNGLMTRAVSLRIPIGDIDAAKLVAEKKARLVKKEPP